MSWWQLLFAHLRCGLIELMGGQRRRALEKRSLERFLRQRLGLSRSRAAQLTVEFYDGQH
jgi:hypothetical protein